MLGYHSDIFLTNSYVGLAGLGTSKFHVFKTRLNGLQVNQVAQYRFRKRGLHWPIKTCFAYT